MVPWRVKYFVSEYFPVIYHVLANVNLSRTSEAFWDHAFDVSWSAGSRVWPDKNNLIFTLSSSNQKVLDVGCGTGSTLLFLQQHGYRELHGLEVSARAVEVLGEQGLTMHKGKLPDFPVAIEAGEYDVIIASQVLEHFFFRGKIIKNARKALKVSGIFIVFVPDDCLGPIDEPSHVIKFTKSRLKRELAVCFDHVFVASVKDSGFDIPILFACAQGVNPRFTDDELLSISDSIFEP